MIDNNKVDIHFDIDGELKDTLNQIDRTSIRTRFKQASDPVNLAFRHIDSKPLSYLAKDFVKSSASDVIELISGFFK